MLAFLVYVFISLTPVFVLFYMAIEIYKRNKPDRVNKIASQLLLSMMVLFLGDFLTSLFPDHLFGPLSLLLIYAPSFVLMGSAVHFCFSLTDRFLTMPKAAALLICYAPSLPVLLLFYPFSWISDSFMQDGLWRYEYPSEGLLNVTMVSAAYTIIACTYLIIANYNYVNRLGQNLKRKQIRILLLAHIIGSIWVIPFTFFRGVLIIPEDINMPDLGLFGALIFALLVRYSMMKYDFLPSNGREYQKLVEMSPMPNLLIDHDDHALHSREQERARTEAEIRSGLENGEFALYYQPQTDMKTGRTIGAEALLRWIKPDVGMVSPDEFIPLAEDTGIIVDIGYWVLDTACRQLQSWILTGMQPVCLSINLSARQFLDPCFPNHLLETLKRTGIDPGLLCLEITERTAMSDEKYSLQVCRDIMSLGVKLSIDDFGTGYSSLALLKNLSVQSIKIDRSFVKDMVSDENDRTIINAIIAMSHSLGKRVVAEGVEKRSQWDMLSAMDCDDAQGYYVSRPLSANDFYLFCCRKVSCL